MHLDTDVYKRMMIAIAGIGFLVLLYPCVVAAQDVNANCEEDENATAPRSERVQHADTTGIWFRIDIARCLLADVQELALLGSILTI